MPEINKPLLDRTSLEQDFTFQPAPPPNDLPNIPFTGVAMPMVDGEPTPSALSAFQNGVLNASKPQSDKLMGGSILRTLDEVTSKRYDNFVPGDYDNEDAYGQGQSWADKMVNGVGKGLVLTGTTFLQSTAGLVNGVANAIGDGRAASFYDNEFNRSLDEFNKMMEDKMPNYYTNVEKNAAWYSPSKLVTANFFWDGIVKNMGFAAGAALSGGVFAAGLRNLAALPGMARLFSVGKAAETLAATEEALLATGKSAQMTAKIKELSDKFLGTYNVLNTGQRVLVAGLATTGEAGFEAYHNLNDFRAEKLREYEELHGEPPVGEDLEQINRLSDNVGNSSFLLNTALLSATNYIQFPKILGSSYKAEKGMLNGISREIDDIAEEGGKYVAKNTRGKIASGVGRVAPYTFSAPEAFEEGAQFAIGVGTKDYYDKALRGVDNDVMSSIMEGISKTIGTNEGMENVLIGGFSGALMTARGRFREGSEKSKNTADAIKSFNQWKISDFTKETIDAVNRGTVLQEQRAATLQAGDVLNSKDLERDYIINYLTPRIKYGRMDLVTADIAELRALASTDKGFALLQAEGKALQGDTRVQYLKRLENLSSTAENLKSLYQSLTVRYGNQRTAEGKPLYSSAVMDKMIYAAAKVADYDQRITDIESGLAAQEGVTDLVQQEILATETEKYKEDLVTLNERRNQFVKEYNDIKTKPEEYQEAEAPEIDPAKMGTTIETEEGQEPLEVGVEYYVEKEIEVKETDKPIKKYSRFTVLSEEGDEVLVQTADGKKFKIKKDKFKGFKTFKVSSAKSSNAIVFVEMSDTIFAYNEGKGDANPKGRISYRSADDSLWFESLDGKTKKRITRTDLSPQINKKTGKKYDVAKVYTKGKFSERATEALAVPVTIEEKLAARNRIVQELYIENKAALEDVGRAITKTEKSLELIVAKLKEETYTKKGKLRKQTAKVKSTIDALIKEKQVAEKSLNDLKLKKSELEDTLTYLQDLTENVRELPEDSKELLEQLKEDVSNIKELIKSTDDSIEKSIKHLVNIEDAIKLAFQYLDKLVADFRTKNPKIPLDLEALQSQVEVYLGEEGARQYIENKEGFTQTLLDFQEFLSGQEEDLKIPDMTKQAQALLDKIVEMQATLSDLKKEQVAKEKVLEKFKAVAEKFQREQAEAEKLAKNEALRAELLGSADPGQNIRSDNKNYEPDAKKTSKGVVTSSKPTKSDRPHHVRANKFGINYLKFSNQKKEQIKAVFVTAKNEAELGLKGLTQFLIDQSDATPTEKATADPNKTVVMVMVKNMGPGKTPVLVDVNGDEITGLGLEEGIFQVMPDPSLTWGSKFGNSSMFRKGTPKEVVDHYTKQYKEWVNNTLANPSLEMHGFEPSFGKPQYVTRKDENGKDVRDYDAVITVEESGLVSAKELNGNPIPLVRIPATNESITTGAFTFNSPLGRPLLRVGNMLVPLQNRKLTKNEVNTIYKAVLQLAKIVNTKGTIKNEQGERLVDWLKSIVYWGTPKNAAGHNSIFFESSPEGLVLKISGAGQAIFPFTATGIELNKAKIIALLEGMYNNVQSGRTDKAGVWDQPYYEITDFKEDGEPEYREWPNYQTYLLSRGGRKDEEIPLHTGIRPLKDENDSNRESVYFRLTNAPKEITEPVSTKLVPIEPPKNGEPAVKVEEPKKEEVKKEEPKPTTSEFVLDGKTENTIKMSMGTLVFKSTDKIHTTPDGVEYVEVSAWPADEATGAAFLAKYTTPAKAAQMMGAVANKKIIDQIKANKPVDTSTSVKVEEVVSPVVQPEVTVEVKGETKPEETNAETVTVSVKDRIAALKKGAAASKKPFSGNARLKKIVDRFKKFKPENWKKTEEWLKANFPNVPVYRIKNALKAANGEELWGMLQDGAIYVYENAEEGTVYHEVFEAVWKMFSDPVEQKAVTNEFRNREGSFIDRPTGKTVKYSQATPFQIKEQLAEEFRDFVLYKKTPAKPKDGRPWILRMFSELVASIKALFVGREARSKVEKMFQKIGTGYHKTNSPFTSSLSLANKGILDQDSVTVLEGADYRIKNIPADKVNEMMQDMTYTTLQTLVSNNENLFNIRRINKEALYTMLRQSLKDNIGVDLQAAEDAASQGLITADELHQVYVEVLVMDDKITKEWQEIRAKHEEYLSSYDIEFDENDEIALREDEKSKEDVYGDSTKIDNFKKANGAVKLLLSTLPYLDSEGNPQLSSINGVKLIPTSQAFMAIMNNVHTSRSVDEMIERIGKMAESDRNYSTLYAALTRMVGIEDIDTTHDAQIIAAFWRTFKKQAPEVKNVYIFENGDIEVGDSNLATAANQIATEFSSALVASIRENKNKYFTYSKKDSSWIGDPKELKEVKLDSVEKRIAFLKEFGINFTAEEVFDLSDDRFDSFVEAVDGIKKSIEAKEKIVSVTNKVLDIKGRIKGLATIRAVLDNPEFTSTFFNVKGERTQTFIGTNAASDLFDAISQINNISELIGTQYEYLLSDNFAKNSVILDNMFDQETGEKKEKADQYMKTAYADGTVNQETGRKKQTAKLSYKERLVQEVNLNLKGFFYNLVPGDASIQWMTYTGTKIKADLLLHNFNSVHKVFEGYFTSEVELAREGRKIVSPATADRNTQDLRFFKAILGDDLHNEIMGIDGKKSTSKRNANMSPQELYLEYKEKIDKAVSEYVKRDAFDNFNTFVQYGIIEATEKGFKLNGIELTQAEEMEKDTILRHFNALSANYMIANIEQHKLLYSDPYQYEDELKRIKNFNSPRQAVVHSSPKMNSAFNRVWNRGFDGIGRTDFTRDFFRTTTLADVVGTINLPGYKSYKETDGSGIISLKALRNFRIRAGEWNDAEEAQYKYDTAYEKNDKGITLSKDEKATLEAGNPEVKSTYTPIKPIVSGNKANNRPYNDVLLDKFALYPLSYRIVKEMAKTGNTADLNTLKMYEKMQREDIDYVVFKSGRKVGAEQANNVYNNDGSFSNLPFGGIINTPFSIMSIQAEVPSKETNSVTRGSQVTKLVTMDFMEAGIPVDFMPKEEFSKRYVAWNTLADKSSYEGVEKDKPNLYQRIQENEKLLNQSMQVAYEGLLQRLGIKENADHTFSIVDFTESATLLRNEVIKREVNDNISDALQGFIDGDTTIEATPAYQQIRNILYSIADKAVISPKINGGQKVQIPSTMFEVERIAKSEKGFTSNVLKFYEDEDGKRVCEVMIGRWFKSDKTDAELLEYLNNTEEGKKVLSGLGFRIPTQKQNSIDSFVIKQFLPTEFGDSIVIPAALVEKAGSDFDIDKLSLYLKNVYVDLKGFVHVIPFIENKEKALEKFRKMFDDGLFLSDKQRKTFNKYVKARNEEVVDKTSEEILRAAFGVEAWEDAFLLEVVDDMLDVKNINDLREKVINKAYAKSLENAYIESMQGLVSHPLNFKNLIKPNSADQLKDLAADITEKLGFGSFDYTSTGNMLNRRFMSRLRHAFVTGKYAIGIAAVNQTNHSLNQRQPIYIDLSRWDILSEEDRYWLSGGTMEKEDATIKFKHFNKIEVNGKKVPTFSMISSAATKNPDHISDIIAQFIDGYVDISKGPWIMELGATPNVASTWLTLVKIGVPIDEIAYFMNQPIIRDYLASIEKDGYSWLFMKSYVDDMKASSKYAVEESVAGTVKAIPSLSSLKSTVGAKELDAQQKAEQQFILDEFLKYAKLSEHMFHVTQGSNFDTATFNDPLLIYKKQKQYEKAQSTIISSVDALIENSFLDKMKDTLYLMRDAIAEFLPSDKVKVRSVVEKALEPYTDLNDKDFVKVGQKVVSSLFDFAVQTSPSFVANVEDILLSDKNVAKQISDFIDTVKADPSHPLYNNQVIKTLVRHSADKPGGVNVVKIKNKDNKVYDQNQMIYSFIELQNYLKSHNNEALYDRLVFLSVLQSGLSRSPISFTTMLPYADFKKIYNETLSKIENIPNLGLFNKLNVFERNNWNDDDVVPHTRAKYSSGGKYNLPMTFNRDLSIVGEGIKQVKLPQLLKVNSMSGASDNDIISYTWEKMADIWSKEEVEQFEKSGKVFGVDVTPFDMYTQNFIKEKKAQMKKEGDWSFIQKGLFKKVYNSGEPLTHTYTFGGKLHTEFIYKAINAWGDSHTTDGNYFSANEYYKEAKKSKIENGYLKIEKEASDDTINAYFDATVKPKGTTELPECA